MNPARENPLAGHCDLDLQPPWQGGARAASGGSEVHRGTRDFAQRNRGPFRAQPETGDGPAGWPRRPHQSIPLLPSGPGGIFDL